MNSFGTNERKLILWLASASSVVLCLFGNLGAIGLLGPDEPRYAWIARAMAETGDWVTPRLYGQPWFEKPILYYWAAAVGFRFHLPAEWAARLPSAVAALAAALAIGSLAWKCYATHASSFCSPALLAPLLFATSVGVVGFSRSASPDMLFSASMALAMTSAARLLAHARALRPGHAGETTGGGDGRQLALFGLFVGLGVLAKGPAAMALAGGAIGLWALLTHKWRAAFRLAHPMALGAFCVVTLPWYVLCAKRNPDFLRVFVLQHNFERYLTPMFQHRQPLWFFGPIVALALVPWTALLWPVAQQALRLWREKSWNDSPGFFISCWAAFPVVFFSFSQSKLPGYVLPSIPPLALLCAIGAIRAMEKGSTETRGVFGALGITWVLMGIAVWAALPRLVRGGSENVHTLGTSMLIIGLLIGLLIVLVSAWRPPLAIAACVFTVAIAAEIVSLTILPQLDPFLSARTHAAFMRNDRHPDRIFTYRLHRDWNYGLAFYFHREIPEWFPGDREAALVLTTPDGLAGIRKLGRLQGELDEPYVGVLYVPVGREPR